MQAAAEPAILADSRPVEHRAVLAEALRGQRDVLPWREVGASATDMRAPAAGNHPLPTGPLTFDNALMPRPTMPAVSAGILLPPEAGLMGDAEGDPSSLPSVTLSSGPAVAFSATAGSAAAVSAAGASRQVAEAVLHLYGDRTEIALSPEELGSVRLVVSRGENGPSLTVWVERPEVLEMLRRNSDALLADLQDGGLDGAALDFRDSGEWQDQGGGGSGDDAAQTLAIGLTGRGDAVPDNEADHRAKSGGHDVGRLDIRV
ncbi:flagellar hook-length control protein FliK [Paracoccus tegillarcae]|nr:flagellar hook-length control protein FliK [Paracoccus tegillarcae]